MEHFFWWGGGEGAGEGLRMTLHTVQSTHPSTDVMDLGVTEWKINTLWLELSSRDCSVHNTNEGHSIMLIINNKGIQKRILHHLLHSSRPSVIL